jgi:hypothetical protein
LFTHNAFRLEHYKSRLAANALLALLRLAQHCVNGARQKVWSGLFAFV